ncbi:YwqG family protein [Deinococcus sp. QL22]|nr:YwqG family protein [Deinococcus sp. QL22]
MPEAFKITSFVPASAPLRGPITKFGGQPLWMKDTQWPLSKATARPLRFIGQIDLTQPGLGLNDPTMAYLFVEIYDQQDDKYYEENFAVILQPRLSIGMGGPVGPVATEQEWLLDGKVVNEPDWAEMSERHSTAFEGSDEDFEAHTTAFGGPKLGGTPIAPEEISLPAGSEAGWQLLLQLPEHELDSDNPDNVPFVMDYGDGGTGWFLLSKNKKEARFAWMSN